MDEALHNLKLAIEAKIALKKKEIKLQTERDKVHKQYLIAKDAYRMAELEIVEDFALTRPL